MQDTLTQSDAVAIAGCAPAPNRVPKIFKEVIKVPGAPGKVREIVKRLPTPPTSVIERIIIEPAPQTANVVYETSALVSRERFIESDSCQPAVQYTVACDSSLKLLSSHLLAPGETMERFKQSLIDSYFIFPHQVPAITLDGSPSD